MTQPMGLRTGVDVSYWHNWTFRDVPAPVANQVESGPCELANVLLFRRGIVGELANALKIPL